MCSVCLSVCLRARLCAFPMGAHPHSHGGHIPIPMGAHPHSLKEQIEWNLTCGGLTFWHVSLAFLDYLNCSFYIIAPSFQSKPSTSNGILDLMSGTRFKFTRHASTLIVNEAAASLHLIYPGYVYVCVQVQCALLCVQRAFEPWVCLSVGQKPHSSTRMHACVHAHMCTSLCVRVCAWTLCAKKVSLCIRACKFPF